MVEVISVLGEKKRFAERSDIMEVPLICPWSEEVPETPNAASRTWPSLALLLNVLLSRHFGTDLRRYY